MNETAPRSFLVVRLGALGDIVHTVPAVAALRETFPEARIGWVVERKWSSLVKMASCVDEVICLEPSAAGYLSCIRRLRSGQYDCVIDFQGLYKSALLARFSGAARRVGRDRASAREPGAAQFYSDYVHPAGRHVAEMNVSLAVGAGARQPDAMRFPMLVPQKASKQVKAILDKAGIYEFIVVSPGGGWRSKCWPADRYGAVCADVWGRHGLPAVINIGPGEESLAREVVEAAAPAQSLVLSLPLPQLGALLMQSKLVISADSGPLHLAAALGARTVGLFGPTDPARNGPLPTGLVLCNGVADGSIAKTGAYERGESYSSSMLSLSVEQVCEAVERELVSAL